jgi:hypothetical protein
LHVIFLFLFATRLENYLIKKSEKMASPGITTTIC